MKWYLGILGLLFGLLLSCHASQGSQTFSETTQSNQDTIRIANEELEYEIIIFDPGFNSWLMSYARPRGYHSQTYLENRNRVWVQEWNIRANTPTRYGNLFEMRIEYDFNINYGYEVNYMLYNYLVYYQLKYNIKLGGFAPRI